VIRPAIIGTIVLAHSLAFAQPPGKRDPNWPCQQIKVPELSLATVWSGPAVDPRETRWKDSPAVADLVEKLAPRRQPIDRVPMLLHDFARQAGKAKQAELLQVLVGVFDVLSQERDSVMAGLDRFGGRQKELAAQIREDNEKLRALQTDPSPNAKAVQEMTQQVKWEVEVFEDRGRALGYACDVPNKIEQRLFTLARQIEHELG
jgi:hypothetical protein